MRRLIPALVLCACGVSRLQPLALASGQPDPRAPLVQKESRTPAQRKINSQLLDEIFRRQGQAKQKRVPPGNTLVKIDEKGRALVDLRADVTPELQKKVGQLGGTVVSTSREYHSIIAWVPLLKLERLAEGSGVRAIEPAAEATTVR